MSGERLLVTRSAAAWGFIRAWFTNSSIYCCCAVGPAVTPESISRVSRFSKRSDRRKFGRVITDLPVYRLAARAMAPDRCRRSPQTPGDRVPGPSQLEEKFQIVGLSLASRRHV